MTAATAVRERDIPARERDVLTVREAADYLGVSVTVVNDLCRAGRLRSVEVAGPRTRRIRREWLEQFLERGGA